MNLTITMTNLDDSIRQLKELAEKVREFPKDVARESMDKVGYGNMGISYGEGMNEVFTDAEGIAFAEWGAGFYADTTTIETSSGTFESYPGVWSKDHARTFQAWQFRQLSRLYTKARVHDSQYPYNRMPQHKMQNEAERLRNETEDKAKEYFK